MGPRRTPRSTNNSLASRRKPDELREAVATYEANARAEAAEAYAAALSKYAVSVQTEAEKAMAFAAEQGGNKDA